MWLCNSPEPDDADLDGPDKEEIDVTSHTSYNEAVLLFQMKQFVPLTANR